MSFTPPNYYGTIGSNFLGGNPAAFFTDPNLRIDFGGMSTTTPTAGAPGNLNGMKKDSYQRALNLLSNPVFQSLSEPVQQQLVANPSFLGGNQNQFDFKGMLEQQGINQKETTKLLIEAQAKRAKEANEMGRKNLILGSLLQMPGQIADTLVQASTAHLPYQQEARQMMANTGANLQAGYSNLANMNTQFGNQVTNLFSNAASYRPTIANLAGKYF
jgi:hypothetical protein